MVIRQQNLKKRLIFKISTLSAITTLLLISITGFVTYYKFDEQLKDHLDFAQYHVLQDVENRIDYLIETTENFSKNNVVVKGVNDEQNRLKYLPKMLNGLSDNWGIAFSQVFDISGEPIAYSSEVLDNIIDDKSVHFSLVNGAQQIEFSKGYVLVYNPVFFYDNPQAVVASAIDLKLIFYHMCEMTSDTSISLFRNSTELANYGKEPKREYRLDEIALYRELQTLYSLNIGISYSPAEAVFLKPVVEILLLLTAIGILFIIISILAGFKLGKDISEPILELHKRVKAISPGEKSSCSPIGTDDELETLAMAFDEKTSELVNTQGMLQKYSEELIEANTDLEKRVAERTEELSLAKEKAEEASIMKSQFLANMSHEIRTPMNAIIGFNQLMTKTEPSQKQIDYINKTHQAAHHLLGIINDILDITKIEAGMMTTEKTQFHLFDVLNIVKQLIKPKADEKGLEFNMYFQTDMPAKYIGDPLRLGQILINLTNNAVKYTKEGSVTVSVSANAIDDHQTKLVFAINDSGIGIAEDKISTLFDPFQQAESSTARQYGGTGLGLSISRQLAQLMGGDILLESEINKGSTFTLILPIEVETTTDNGDIRHFPNTKILGIGFDDKDTDFIDYVSNLVGTFDLCQNLQQGCSHVKDKTSNQTYYNLVFIKEYNNNLDAILQKLEKTTGRFGRIHVVFTTKPDDYDTLEITYPALIFNVLTENYEASEVLNVVYNSSSEITQIAPELIIKAAPAEMTFDTNILIVEDNEVNRQIIKELLKHNGIKSHSLNNGAEALEYLSDPDNAAKYSLVFMDIQMPVMDGYQAVDALMKYPHMKALPIVALTADAVDSSISKAEEVGMSGYITKPYSMQKILEAIKKWSKTKNLQSINSYDVLYGIDKAKWLKSYANDEGLFNDSIKIFIESNGNTPREVASLIENAKFDEARQKTHSFVGAAGACCLTNGFVMAKNLDKTLLDGETNIPKLLKLAVELVEESDKVTESIKNHIANIDKKSSTKKPNTEETTKIVEHLKEMLDEGDIHVRKYFLEHKDALTVYLNDSEISHINKHISLFDFNAALQLLESSLNK